MGELISTIHPIKTRNDLFASNSSPAGVRLITNKEEEQKIICNDQIINLKPTETKSVIVNHEIGLNFTKLLRSERMTPAMEKNNELYIKNRPQHKKHQSTSRRNQQKEHTNG